MVRLESIGHNFGVGQGEGSGDDAHVRDLPTSVSPAASSSQCRPFSQYDVRLEHRMTRSVLDFKNAFSCNPSRILCTRRSLLKFRKRHLAALQQFGNL